MRSTPSYIRVASFAGACALLASCERKPTEPLIPPQFVPRQPSVIAVSAPDSLAPTTPLKVWVHYFSRCTIESPPTTAWSGDTLTITPWVTPTSYCPPLDGWGGSPYPASAIAQASLSIPPHGTIPIQVLSAFGMSFTSSVTVGVAPLARGFVQRIEVVRGDGVPAPGANITVTMNQAPWDTLADVITDHAGRAEIVIDAPGSQITVHEYVRPAGGGGDQLYQGLRLDRDQPLKTRILDRP